MLKLNYTFVLAVAAALLLALSLAPLTASAEEDGDTGKLYLDESYFDAATGEFHIVISLLAATQFLQDLVAGEAKVNYISLPDPKSGKKDSGKLSSKPKNAPLPNLQEITGFTRDELEGIYQYAAPEIDSQLKKEGLPSFRRILDSYDLLQGAEEAEGDETATEAEAAPEEQSDSVGRTR